MGVPAFYRWLREKYPKTIEDVVEEMPGEIDGREVPVSFHGKNPNGIEFDNLYLDMNGIIHPCVHPEDVPAPETVEEMFAAIFAYLDRLMHAVRPRKLVFMAIDGVAPRAKMNQQRSRRFKTAQEMQEQEEVEEALRKMLRAKGQKVPPKKKSTFDHNVITPGTWFMDRLSLFLRYYILQRMSSDSAWKDVRVILSDASVPGEGEHKIMEFIRQQRAQPGYNPNIRHILHGLDADLIMLGLATHEPHFTILREDILGKTASSCFICGRGGHRADQCTGIMPMASAAAREEALAEAESAGAGGAGAVKSSSHNSLRSIIQRKPLQFLHLPILREYLAMEFAHLAVSLPFPFELERVIDDFVFMCFFVGNDFLPHLPSLDIREGAIDLLLNLYKQLLPSMGGYLTWEGHVDLSKVDILLSQVGAVEDEIFRRRQVKEEKDRRIEAQKQAERERAAAARAAEEARRKAFAHPGEDAHKSEAERAGYAKEHAGAIQGVKDALHGHLEEIKSSRAAAAAQLKAVGGAGGKKEGAGAALAAAAAEAGFSPTAAGLMKQKGAGKKPRLLQAQPQQFTAAPTAEELAKAAAEAAAIAAEDSIAASSFLPGIHFAGAAGGAAGGAGAAAGIPGLLPPGLDVAGAPSSSSSPSLPPGLGVSQAEASKVKNAENSSAAAALRSSLRSSVLGGGGGGAESLASSSCSSSSASLPATATAAAAAVASSEEGEGGEATLSGHKRARSEASEGAEKADSGLQLAESVSRAGGAAAAGEEDDEGPEELAVQKAPQQKASLYASSSSRSRDSAELELDLGEQGSDDDDNEGGGGDGEEDEEEEEGEPLLTGAAAEDALALAEAAVAAVEAAASDSSSVSSESEDEDDEEGGIAPGEEGLADSHQAVSSAVTTMFKTAVKQALQMKHTHDYVTDEVKLGVTGFKQRYYCSKFGEEEGSDPAFKAKVYRSYAEGLVWVFRYYYQGVASWTWFYPYHYAPFASDLRNLDSLDIQFELGKPFRPIDQLMAVLPARSSHALPPALGALMRQKDSSIADFYPERFATDPNGKKQSWLWVPLLPFIDEKRLVPAVDALLHTLTEEERKRNSWGNEMLFVREDSALGKILAPLVPMEDIATQKRLALEAEAGALALESEEGERKRKTGIVAGVGAAEGVGSGVMIQNLSQWKRKKGAAGGADAAAQLSKEGSEGPVELLPQPAVSGEQLVSAAAAGVAAVVAVGRAAASTAAGGAAAAAVGEDSATANRDWTGSSAAAAGPDSSVRVIVLRPDMGDGQNKGFSGRAVSFQDGGCGLRGIFAAPIGGSLPSPWSPVMPDVKNNRAVSSILLHPQRALHICKLLPGCQLPRQQLDPAEDDPSGRVPRLTKGMNIADLAYVVLGQRGAGGGASAAFDAKIGRAFGSMGGQPDFAGPAGAMRAFGQLQLQYYHSGNHGARAQHPQLPGGEHLHFGSGGPIPPHYHQQQQYQQQQYQQQQYHAPPPPSGPPGYYQQPPPGYPPHFSGPPPPHYFQQQQQQQQYAHPPPQHYEPAAVSHGPAGYGPGTPFQQQQAPPAPQLTPAQRMMMQAVGVGGAAARAGPVPAPARAPFSAAGAGAAPSLPPPAPFYSSTPPAPFYSSQQHPPRAALPPPPQYYPAAQQTGHAASAMSGPGGAGAGAGGAFFSHPLMQGKPQGAAPPQLGGAPAPFAFGRPPAAAAAGGAGLGPGGPPAARPFAFGGAAARPGPAPPGGFAGFPGAGAFGRPAGR